ncbi:MAG: hypothetical protein C0602_12395 [Denitrovibrio sp.]|mgnify:CR=1 FL=1|nr:MAG: hypothetical protein C0602_12395 [Denitrovibrio sp.]
MLKNLDFLRNTKVRILVIDTSQENSEAVSQLLTDNGFFVKVSTNGENGIASARKLLPDIIIINIEMSDIEGCEVCSRIKDDSKTKDIPVIFITAKTARQDIMNIFEAGAVDYVIEPVVQEELLIKVNRHSQLASAFRKEKQLLDIVDNYVLELIIDIEGDIRQVSSVFLNLTGYEEEEIIGNSFRSLKHPDNFRSELSDMLDSVKNNYAYYKEIIIATKDKQKCFLKMYVDPIKSVDGKVTGAHCFMTDVTSKKELEHLSITDKLTGLNNRQKLDQVLQYEYSQSQRYGSVFSIILLDLDDFKQVNNNHGHLVGDNVLIKLADILRANVRDSDTVGRWGGEEFLVVVTKASEQETKLVAEKLRLEIESENFNISTPVTASMGVCSNNGDTAFNDMLSLADRALYQSKRKGKNRIISASEL